MCRIYISRNLTRPWGFARTTNRPVIRAIELLRHHADTKERVFPTDEDVPLTGWSMASGVTPIDRK